jgi:hypothetical protein
LRDENNLALFLLLGQAAQRAIAEMPDTVPPLTLPLSSSFDLACVLPNEARRASRTCEVFILLHVFENFLRDFVLDVLTEANKDDWWSLVPKDVQEDVDRLEKTEAQKQWMALDSRSKLALATLPQLLRIMDEPANWKNHFEEHVRDKLLIQEGRLIAHVRNTVCHMSDVPSEEVERVKQVMRDWFRVVAP